MLSSLHREVRRHRRRRRRRRRRRSGPGAGRRTSAPDPPVRDGPEIHVGFSFGRWNNPAWNRRHKTSVPTFSSRQRCSLCIENTVYGLAGDKIVTGVGLWPVEASAVGRLPRPHRRIICYGCTKWNSVSSDEAHLLTSLSRSRAECVCVCARWFWHHYQICCFAQNKQHTSYFLETAFWRVQHVSILTFCNCHCFDHVYIMWDESTVCVCIFKLWWLWRFNQKRRLAVTEGTFRDGVLITTVVEV